ENTPS
ncbi:hypothetical protein VCCP1035_3467B, partial [Vibrio cholerae CP1035(8)]